jgi:ketosteroid isomerase-like protein
MTTLDKTQKKKIWDVAGHLSDFALKNKWIPHYDSDTDSLVLHNPNLSSNARKKYFNDELAFYITNDGKIEGVFVEYFKSNFLSHHQEYKGALKSLKQLQKAEENDGLIALQKGDLKKLAALLESDIVDSFFERLETKDAQAGNA